VKPLLLYRIGFHPFHFEGFLREVGEPAVERGNQGFPREVTPEPWRKPRQSERWR
jgi:hypothetical protein